MSPLWLCWQVDRLVRCKNWKRSWHSHGWIMCLCLWLLWSHCTVHNVVQSVILTHGVSVSVTHSVSLTQPLVTHRFHYSINSSCLKNPAYGKMKLSCTTLKKDGWSAWTWWLTCLSDNTQLIKSKVFVSLAWFESPPSCEEQIQTGWVKNLLIGQKNTKNRNNFSSKTSVIPLDHKLFGIDSFE